LRPLVLSNHKFFVGFDRYLNMRDFYYPYVGSKNHINGNKNSLGVFRDGRFAWCDDHGWDWRLGYRAGTFVTEVWGKHPGLQVELKIAQAIHYIENIYLQEIEVKNFGPEGEIKVYLTHDFAIDESDVACTALYDPQLKAIYHYKDKTYILANGGSKQVGVFEFSTGTKRFKGAEGTWRDAEDGSLQGNPIAQGSVDSTIGFSLYLGSQQSKKMYYWLVVGPNYQEIRRLNEYVVTRGAGELLRRVDYYWRSWLKPQALPGVFGKMREEYDLSLFITAAHMDRHGAIIAANDTDIMAFNLDHYSYVWPRDGAFVAKALIDAGYDQLTKPFFQFVNNALTAGGYLLHKYNPNGTLGSSWHPWYQNGEEQLPIQEDETALVLWALKAYYEKSRDLPFMAEIYPNLIQRAGNFLASYYQPELKLPRPSYDPWEERLGIFTYTCATVCAGLEAAAYFAGLFGNRNAEQRYTERRQQILEGMRQHLYDRQLNSFVRGLNDRTLDASLLTLPYFGVLAEDDPMLVSTMEKVIAELEADNQGGICRYIGDQYFYGGGKANPWVICTLWAGRWRMLTARAPEHLQQATKYLRWALDHALESGVLAEQLTPGGEPKSVAPLTWSHAVFIDVVQMYSRCYEKLCASQERYELIPPA